MATTIQQQENDVSTVKDRLLSDLQSTNVYKMTELSYEYFGKKKSRLTERKRRCLRLVNKFYDQCNAKEWKGSRRYKLKKFMEGIEDEGATVTTLHRLHHKMLRICTSELSILQEEERFKEEVTSKVTALKVRLEKDNDRCVYCTDELSLKSDVRLKCNHVMCLSCFFSLASKVSHKENIRYKECPQCRTKIEETVSSIV
jgi:hypothetical protein